MNVLGSAVNLTEEGEEEEKELKDLSTLKIHMILVHGVYQ